MLENRIQLNIRITAELGDELKAAALRRDLTASQLVRQLIEDELNTERSLLRKAGVWNDIIEGMARQLGITKAEALERLGNGKE